MKTKYLLFLFIISIILISCQTSKPQAGSKDYKSKPEWVVSKPQSSQYYIGISSVSKKVYDGDNSKMKKSAQEQALADLALQISVNIESSSFLSVVETNKSIEENYTKEMKASTNEALEGYELVDTYEDKYEYYVYYRLSKSTYQTQKAAKKQKAIETAKTKLQEAQKLIEKKLYVNAFQFYCDALTSIKPYLGETTMTEINGEQRELGNFIYSRITAFLNNIKLEFPKNEVKIIDENNFNKNDFVIIAKYKEEFIITNLPIKLTFNGIGLMRDNEISDSEGKIYCSFSKIKIFSSSEILSAAVDVINLSKAAKDPIIRDIIKTIPATETKIRITN